MTRNDKTSELDAGIPLHRRPWPAKLFVETTTRCNLRCIMCVKETWNRSAMEGDMADETFAALEQAFPYLESLVLNGVGEPLLDSRLEEFIRRAKKLMPPGSWVGFQSNGMLFDEQRAVALVAAGLDRICLSADALNPETFRSIRRGGEEQGIERAFAALHTARIACNRQDLHIGLEFVLMRDNTSELPGMLRKAVSLGASFAIVTHVLPYAESRVALSSFDPNMDEAVKLFSEWKSKAAAEGLDIGTYFNILWKYMRTPSDRELAIFLLELAEDASPAEVVERLIGSSLPSKQIAIKGFVDTGTIIKQIFPRDSGWKEAMKRVFAELSQCGTDPGEVEAKLRKIRTCPGTEDSDIFKCLVIIWKYTRTPREQRVFDLVEEMKAEARARGISVHLKNLMERNEEWASELEEVFAEARAIAESTGLSLRLPGTSPSSRRRCDFIESGSVFVSWNGNVHPCYFLWHQYGCHLFGRKKFVQPKVFGNVQRQGILDIWNGAEFRAFRDEVLTYDFPYCSNCNVVPCQYLIAEEFEQDCYGNSVPCGDCFWCMGMFNCLQ